MLTFLSLWGSAQSNIWSIGQYSLDFSNNTISQDVLPFGDPNQLLQNYPSLFSFNSSTPQFNPINYVYQGTLPSFSSNIVYDDNNKVKFFVVDGNVYNHDGVLIAKSALETQNNIGDGLLEKVPEGFSETVIVPVPGKCNSYYIIASSTEMNLANKAIGVESELIGIEIDFSIINEYYNQYPSALRPLIMGEVKSIKSITNGQTGCAIMNIAATPIINSIGERYLYVNRCSEIFVYKISVNGISLIDVYSENVNTNVVAAQGVSPRAESEVVKRADNKYIHAMPVVFDPFVSPANATVAGVEIREFKTSTGAGFFPSNDGRRKFFIELPNQTPGFPLSITGIEFSKSGRYVYILVKNSPNLYWFDIDDPVFNSNTLNGSQPWFIGVAQVRYIGGFFGNSFEGSQIEMGIDGKMYFMADEDRMFSIDNTEDPYNLVFSQVGTITNLDNFPAQSWWYPPTSLTPADYSSSLYLLMDQIDGENYSTFTASSPGCCSKNLVYDKADYTLQASNTIEYWNPATLNNGILLVDGTVTVPSGKRLVIQNMTVKFSQDSKIVVEQGGRLVVSEATLTSVDCNGVMWQGIEVKGNPNIQHLPHYTVQGFLDIPKSNSFTGFILVLFFHTCIKKSSSNPLRYDFLLCCEKK